MLNPQAVQAHPRAARHDNFTPPGHARATPRQRREETPILVGTRVTRATGSRAESCLLDVRHNRHGSRQDLARSQPYATRIASHCLSDEAIPMPMRHSPDPTPALGTLGLGRPTRLSWPQLSRWRITYSSSSFSPSLDGHLGDGEHVIFPPSGRTLLFLGHKSAVILFGGFSHYLINLHSLFPFVGRSAPWAFGSGISMDKRFGVEGSGHGQDSVPCLVSGGRGNISGVGLGNWMPT